MVQLYRVTGRFQDFSQLILTRMNLLNVREVHLESVNIIDMLAGLSCDYSLLLLLRCGLSRYSSRLNGQWDCGKKKKRPNTFFVGAP